MSTETSPSEPAAPDPTLASAPTLPPPIPAIAPIPAPAGLTPVLGPLMMLLRSRKGVVMLSAVAFCALVYLRDPSKLDKIVAFLSYVLTVWFGSHAWQESKAIDDK